MDRHGLVSVAPRPFSDDEDQLYWWRARCLCSWTTPWYSTRGDARESVLGHIDAEWRKDHDPYWGRALRD